ncbi:hypothetical protein EVAR_98062_1 [Eumeta japonica]|uniref:Mos1 transposase HTH domain-containing protein n=1 Tax=Eumeta variegata TaxID=151549 RepID=A0A4C1WBU8_EUMVA|nr:hypothetical protein EVAR_98062_1 [Eumeta japonica]
MIHYDFKVAPSEEQCVQLLQSTFNNEAPSRATVSRRFRDFVVDVTHFTMKKIREGLFEHEGGAAPPQGPGALAGRAADCASRSELHDRHYLIRCALRMPLVIKEPLCSLYGALYT